MALNAALPADLDLISDHAALIREARAAINQIQENETADLLPALATAANADTSPSVTGVFVLATANAGATTINFFDDGYEGQVIGLVAGDANTTVQHDTGLIFLTSRANTKLILGEAMLFALQGGKWHEIGGYKRTSMKTISDAAYTILATDGALRANGGGNAITLTLLGASTVSHGHTIRIKKTDSVEANVITIERAGADTVNALTTPITLTLQNESVTLVSDGVSDWTTFN